MTILRLGKLLVCAIRMKEQGERGVRVAWDNYPQRRGPESPPCAMSTCILEGDEWRVVDFAIPEGDRGMQQVRNAD